MADQLELIGPRGGVTPRRPSPRAEEPGRTVAVLVDAPVAHLARPFDYAVPRTLDARVVPGCRVRVRLSGQLVDGIVLGPGDPAYDGPVRPLDAVVSSVPVLTADVLALCRAVAGHYAGSLADVVRLAVPPRVAAAERDWRPRAPDPPPPAPAGAALAGHALIAAAAAGRPARGAWAAPAGTDVLAELAAAAAAVAAAGRTTLIVVPDGRDLDRLQPALTAVIPAGQVAVLRADAGPQQRYREFLRILAGGVRVVAGTRAAVFSPLPDPALLVVVDDGDDALAEPRTPYPHARDVLALRAHQHGCALLVAGFARSCDTQQWVEQGWLGEVSDRLALRARRPVPFATADRVRSAFDPVRRLPQAAVACLRDGVAHGPVLVHVGRRGYQPVTACATCRELARCPRCDGPLAIAADGTTTCRRCGASDPFRCPHCQGTTLRAVRAGASRVGEELGRMFPQVPVVVSTAEHPVAQVPARPAVVVATAGVEPRTPAGYAAAAFPDAQDDLWRPGLRAREQALRRWLNAAALLRPGAPLAVNADPEDPAVQALIRWDPVGFAAGELARRRELGLPPAARVVQLDGPADDLADVVEQLGRTLAVTALGPRPLDGDGAGDAGRARVLLRADDFPALTARSHELLLRRSAARRGGLRLQVDPPDLE